MKLKYKIFSFQLYRLTERQRQEEAVMMMEERNHTLQEVNTC